MFAGEAWNYLSVIAIISIIISLFARRSSIWDTLILGMIIAIIVAIVYIVRGGEINWTLSAKIVVVSVLVGLFIEMLGWISKKTGAGNK